MLARIFISLITDLVLLFSFIYLPIMRAEEAFFGTRVSRELFLEQGRQILHRYWFWLVMTFLEIEVIGFFISRYKDLPPPFTVLWSFSLFLPAAVILYVIFARQIKAFEILEESARFASALHVRRFSDYTSITMEVINLALIIAPLFLLAYFYPQLPERIPVHWNWRGEPDSWARKSIATVFALPLTTIYLQGLLLLIKRDLLETKMTLPATHTQEYFEGKELQLSLSLRLIDRVRLLETVLMCGLAINLALTALPWQPGAGIMILISAGATLALIGFSLQAVIKMIQINREIKARCGREYVQRKTDANCWYLGGLIYYNPEDAALFVEKLVGIGYTFNLGNRRVYIYFVYLLLIPIFVHWITVNW